MQKMYKLGLAVGLGFIGMFCYGAHIKSEVKKVKKEQSRIERQINWGLLQINKRLDNIEERVRIQLTYSGILEQYDADRDGIINDEEWDKYLDDVSKVERVLSKYDTDSSGRLNREELYGLIEDFMEKHGVSQRESIERIVNHALKRYDRNRREGLLNRLELQKLIHGYETAFSDRF